jgi:hypothetical protein
MNLNTISLPIKGEPTNSEIPNLYILAHEGGQARNTHGYSMHYHLNLDTGISLYSVNECALLSLNYYKKYLMKIIHGKKKNETFWNIHTFENEDCFQYLV